MCVRESVCVCVCVLLQDGREACQVGGKTISATYVLACPSVWCGVVWYAMDSVVWCDMIWCGMIWIVWCGVV